MTPELSILVPVRNGAQTLRACLEAICRSDGVAIELIVIDDASSDDTAAIASEFADRVLRHPERRGCFHARQYGIQNAGGKIIVNIDADVVVFPETLRTLRDFFDHRPDIDAVTGLLSKNHPDSGFFTQYKNLYMHDRFRRLPERISFLYGSLFAVRREAILLFDPQVAVADDTAWGQALIAKNRNIALVKTLEVTHLKTYTFASWLKNDFQIAFAWSRIFFRSRGWRQWGRYKTGFAHASRAQLLSILLVPVMIIACIAAFTVPACLGAALAAVGIWFILNWDFFRFLKTEKGALFFWKAVPITFLDHGIMLAGAASGTVSLLSRSKSRPAPCGGPESTEI